MLSSTSNGVIVVMVLAVVVTAYFVPDLLIYSRGLERQAAIALELPDTLDQMLIAVEAGPRLRVRDGAGRQERQGPAGRGARAHAAGHARSGCRGATPTRRSPPAPDVPDLRAFVRAVVQADIYGISVSTVLRTQAKEMRTKRRQRAEEKAMQIPVKVLFPLMLFILPVLFIAVLGPTIISVVTNYL